MAFLFFVRDILSNLSLFFTSKLIASHCIFHPGMEVLSHLLPSVSFVPFFSNNLISSGLDPKILTKVYQILHCLFLNPS